MTSNDILFITATDANYYPFSVDLIASFKRAWRKVPRIRVLDVRLRADQRLELSKDVEAIIEPGWDLGRGDYPLWFRAMTARPFLPSYAGNAKLIVWMDSDAWVQRPVPLERLIEAALDGKLAIVEEQFGAGFSAPLRTAAGYVQATYDSDSVKANLRRCWGLFGSEGAAYADLPQFNTGVFALRTDSPSWSVWANALAGGLRGGFHFAVEQTALNLAIRRGQIPVTPQDMEANFVCVHELPWFNPETWTLTMPNEKDRPLGIVHLTDAKSHHLLPIPHFPRGEVKPMPLIFRRYVEHELMSRKIGRNERCPCGTGKRYKQCHGFTQPSQKIPLQTHD
jgi:hypothetical protein